MYFIVAFKMVSHSLVCSKHDAGVGWQVVVFLPLQGRKGDLGGQMELMGGRFQCSGSLIISIMLTAL